MAEVEKSEEQAAWENSTFTQLSAKAYARRVAIKFRDFKSACRATTDPKVAAAFQEWVDVCEFHRFLSGNTKGGTDE